MTKKQLNRAEKIVHGYFHEEHSDRVRKIIQDWLAFAKEEKRKNEALWTAFDDLVNEDLSPDQWSYEMLEDLRARIAARKAEIALKGERAERRAASYRLSDFRRIAAVAIPIALLAGAMLWLLYRPGDVNPNLYADLITKTVPDTLGAQDRTALPDGSNILVRPGSSIAWAEDFSAGNIRRVKLDGEAYFDVSKDTARRFVVETDRLKVYVLGTAFNVQSGHGAEQTVVSLYRGRVQAETNDGRIFTLKPGDQLIFDTSGSCSIGKTTGYIPEWIAERLRFKKVPLDELLRTMEWYHGIKVELTGTINPQILYSLELNGSESLDAETHLLEELIPGLRCSADSGTMRVNVENVRRQ